jgi:hypothetical protein
MPVSCANCGAGDVQEVKSNTYFCNYCGQVFRWTDSSHGTILGLGQCGCGKLAAATCTHCGRVLCDVHIRRDDGGKVICLEEVARLAEEAGRVAAQAAQDQEAKFQEAYELAVRGVLDWAAQRNAIVERVLLVSGFAPDDRWGINKRLAKDVSTRLLGDRLLDYVDVSPASWKAWAIRSDQLAGWLTSNKPSVWSKRIKISRLKSSPVFELPAPGGPSFKEGYRFLLPDGRIAGRASNHGIGELGLCSRVWR